MDIDIPVAAALLCNPASETSWSTKLVQVNGIAWIHSNAGTHPSFPSSQTNFFKSSSFNELSLSLHLITDRQQRNALENPWFAQLKLGLKLYTSHFPGNFFRISLEKP